jgi:hypothetical protein
MNYERGLVRLQEQLEKIDDKEVARLIADHAAKLRTLLRQCRSKAGDQNIHWELECTINELNKVAYRITGNSFIDLCGRPRSSFSDALLCLSLRGVVLLVIAALLLPVSGIVLASTGIKIKSEWQVEDIRQETQAIDEKIGLSVISPYYLNYIFPCSTTALQAVRTVDYLDLVISTSTSECVWEYVDVETGQVLAKDYWVWSRYPALQKREFYRDGDVIAQDRFDSKGDDCFKRRKYFDERAQVLATECFTEAGVPRAEKLPSSLASPIPPMVYWFFYR